MTVYCDYCGHKAALVDDSEIYGRSFGHTAYLCRNCGAYVGCHGRTDKPLGRLADAALRKWKMAAHASFDPLWKTGPFRGRRKAAYGWLAEQMGLPIEKTHIGMFDNKPPNAIGTSNNGSNCFLIPNQSKNKQTNIIIGEPN